MEGWWKGWKNKMIRNRLCGTMYYPMATIEMWFQHQAGRYISTCGRLVSCVVEKINIIPSSCGASCAREVMLSVFGPRQLRQKKREFFSEPCLVRKREGGLTGGALWTSPVGVVNRLENVDLCTLREAIVVAVCWCKVVWLGHVVAFLKGEICQAGRREVWKRVARTNCFQY